MKKRTHTLVAEVLVGFNEKGDQYVPPKELIEELEDVEVISTLILLMKENKKAGVEKKLRAQLIKLCCGFKPNHKERARLLSTAFLSPEKVTHLQKELQHIAQVEIDNPSGGTGIHPC